MAASLPNGSTSFRVALTGNPNCGKTTLFNALTGLRAKVANYPGVTVERKEGPLLDVPAGTTVIMLDLPGTYSLSPQSIDEQIARDVLFHHLSGEPPPDLVVVVVDASNLQRNLYYATQVIELGYRTLVALNMIDVAERNGPPIDAVRLAEHLGIPVIPVVGSTGRGLKELRAAILRAVSQPHPAVRKSFCELPEALQRETEQLARQLAQTDSESAIHPEAEALLLLSDERLAAPDRMDYPPFVRQAIQSARVRLEAAGIAWNCAAIEARYERIEAICETVAPGQSVDRESYSDKLDRVLTHKVWGLLIFAGLMLLMFQGIFALAQWPMRALDAAVSGFGAWAAHLIPPGALHSLIEDGIIAGVGAVVVFLPQICLLFFFIGLLEDTGYLARAAFLMDRFMSKVGLHGKSFIPMLSCFACAIPGIMATRTIENTKDRLVTILVAPLMTCSARLPVYALLIAACIPDVPVLGPFRLPGLTLMVMYLLGIVTALAMAWIFKKTLLKGADTILIMELPPYKRPLLKAVARHTWDRALIFLKKAGTVILGINILLWFFVSYPKPPSLNPAATPAPVARAAAATPPTDGSAVTGERLRYSFAGRLGHWLEPAIQPLGMDWKMGIGLVTSFAAREVFVSTMSIVYNVSDQNSDAAPSLAQTLRAQKRSNGSPLYTPLMALTLMIFYVFALQCFSTLAVVSRETNSWKWPLFQWLYLGTLAWLAAFLTYQGGRLLGWQ